MTEPPPRIATLVLVDAGGTVLGQLPSFPVTTPWWQDMVPVVAACEERFGVRPIVLRLLSTERGVYPGGRRHVPGRGRGTRRRPRRRPASGLGQEPWMSSRSACRGRSVGGPAADLAWADEALLATGRRRTAEAEQMRTWNLSSVWRLPTTDGPAWLKVVPPFFAHEGAVLERLAGGPVPTLLGRRRPSDPDGGHPGRRSL